jgi:diguanylate cyclase (GGDEF)-like protein
VVEDRFLEETSRRNLRILGLAALIFEPLYVAWGAFDLALAPQHFHWFIALRSACVLLATVVVLLVRRPRFQHLATPACSVFFVLAGAFAAPMQPVVGPAALAYGFGYCLIVLGAGMLPVWCLRWSLITMTVLVALPPLAFLLMETNVRPADIAAHTLCIATMGVISATGSIFKSQLLRREFDMREELHRISITDPLTGLLNRRTLGDRLEAETERARRYDRTLSVLVIDIDHFKKINDTQGHEGGDRALVELANIIRNDVRQTDVVARLGGEEFVVLAPETPMEGALLLAERLRAGIELRLAFTVSIGVASTQHPDGKMASALLKLADEALYRAKHAGRNCVIAAEASQPKFQPPLTTRLAPEM